MSALAVTLTVDELRALVRAEVQAALGGPPNPLRTSEDVCRFLGWTADELRAAVYGCPLRAPTGRDRRRRASVRVRREVIARDASVCGICREAVEAQDVHLDHIRPWSLGGPTTPENLRVTHARCNIRRGAAS